MDGRVLSHYRLIDKIGEGGMGAVYRAEDTRLGRTVALKVLTPQFSSDRLSVERFQREASSASALNNPHICTIHDVGEEKGQWYLVMEYLDGLNLDGRISEGPLPLRELLDISLQAIDAIAAAHECGVVHRDIKPANIFVTRSGVVKLLDFGLARRTPHGSRAASASAAHLASISTQYLTMPGFVVGTANYMSPEQACGAEADARSDLFSFGIVLYQMATGSRPFEGESLPALLNAIVHLPPRPISELNPAVPAELCRIIGKALEKDPDLRYQSAADLRSDLLRLQRQITATDAAEPAPASTGVAPARVGPGSWRRGVGAALLFALCAAALAVFFMAGRAQTSQGPAAFRQITDVPGVEQFPSLDATGEWLVYAARPNGNWDIFLKRVDGRNERNLTDSADADDTQPAYSPDGKSIAFRSSRDGGGIFVMGATGEAPERVSASGYNPCWSPDGTKIAFATEGVDSPEDRYLATSRLSVVDLTTRQTRVLFAGDAVQPAWSPNGRRIAFWRSKGGFRDVATVSAAGGEAVAVTADSHTDWNPAWSPDGRYLYFLSDRSGMMNLWRVAADQNSGVTKGEPEPVMLPSASSGHIRFSRDGRRLVFTSGTFRSTVSRVAFDAHAGAVSGTPEEVPLGFRQATRPHLSADGKWLAFSSKGLIEDIHISQPDGSGLRHITSDGRRNRGPRLSPDGSRVAFFSARSGNNEIWIAGADGTGLRRVTWTGKNAVWPVWSPDGRQLAYTLFGEGSYTIDPDREWTAQRPAAIPSPSARESFSAFAWSPDGERIAGFLQTRKTARFPGSPSTCPVRGLSNASAPSGWTRYGSRQGVLSCSITRAASTCQTSPEESQKRCSACPCAR